MPTYVIGGKRIRTEQPLSDEQIDEIAAELGATAAAPQQQVQGSLVSQIPTEGGYVAPTPQTRQPSLTERLVGAGETALTLGTGATAGTAGLIGGTIEGLVQSARQGKFGTQEGVRMAQEAATRRAAGLTYQPRTQEGKEQTQAVAGFLQEALPPVVPMIGAPGAITTSAGMPKTSYLARRVSSALEKTEPTVVGGKVSAGAAATQDALRRVTVAEGLPVPFTGPAGLTSGQATRNFTQLQFEKEAAKLAEMGAPLRERTENQAATFIQNFDALVDRAEPMRTGKRDVGMAVSQALETKAGAVKNRIRSLYKQADEKGETTAPIDMSPVVPAFDELSRYEGVAPNVTAIRREAMRLGVISDQNGNMVANQASLKNAEVLRQFINQSTDWQDPRQALLAKQIRNAIDSATEGKGGELYKKARKLREDYANEFENVGLTSKLLATKRGTDERQVAFEDVFDKIIVMSPIEETNKLRRSLLTAGNEGKQAWADLKAAGINYIKDASLSGSQADARGNPLLSPAKLNKVVKQLDDEGKLESLYGKKQAQQLRDLAELSTVIYTAPPGAINTSNTASALQVALDASLTYVVSGYPAPVATILRESSRYMKNRETKKRIREALKPVEE
jgi:hypothetical protein